MNKASHTMGKICDKLIKHKRETTSEDSINALCAEVQLVLQLWNNAFFMMNEKDPSIEDCNKTQKLIDLAIEQLFRLALSITPKVYSLLKHIVQQMRSISGGIALMLEYWVEHYHQVAHWYDTYWKRQSSI